MAGYSGTPLAKKLGIKAASRVALLNAASEFEVQELPPGTRLQRNLRGTAQLDVIVLFASQRRELARDLPKAVRRMTPAGGLWLAWPKRASGVPTDLSDASVRELGLETGLVDNKVCAIDEVFSALRFVVRVADRR